MSLFCSLDCIISECQKSLCGGERRSLKTLRGSFCDSIFIIENAFMLRGSSSVFQKKDVERTIGIDTDYIETNDFNLEQADKWFLIEVRDQFYFVLRTNTYPFVSVEQVNFLVEQLSVECRKKPRNALVLLYFALDWSRKLSPFSQPIKSKTDKPILT